MTHNYKMKDMYSLAGISKQAMWKYNKKNDNQQEVIEQVVSHIKQVRINHKRMGCRRIYFTCNDMMPVGRDLFEEIGFSNGYKLRYKRNVFKTTWGQRIEIYPNLIEGLIIDGINKVWQSDIFYIKVENVDYYGVTIEDVYSRKLLALHLSRSLRAEENIRCLRKALRVRKGTKIKGCIFHSDRGSQYISNKHKLLLKESKIKISMCKMPQENAYVERVQGTIKHEYLYEMKLTEANLQSSVKKTIKWYNDERPHSQLNMMTPTAFEEFISKLLKKERPKMQIYQGVTQLLTKN
jgi:putative transposase